MDAINVLFNSDPIGIIFNGEEEIIYFTNYLKQEKKLIQFIELIFPKTKKYKISKTEKYNIFGKTEFDDMCYFRLIKKLRKLKLKFNNVNIQNEVV